VPVSAGIIADADIATAIAGINMPTKSSSATMLDG